jgi:hypothetical protein
MHQGAADHAASPSSRYEQAVTATGNASPSPTRAAIDREGKLRARYGSIGAHLSSGPALRAERTGRSQEWGRKPAPQSAPTSPQCQGRTRIRPLPPAPYPLHPVPPRRGKGDRKNKCGMRGVFLAWIKNVFLSTLATQKATTCPRKTACFYKQSQDTPVKRLPRVPPASSHGNIDFLRREDAKSLPVPPSSIGNSAAPFSLFPDP